MRKTKRVLFGATFGLAGIVLSLGPCEARVTRISVESTTILAGRGASGDYAVIKGRIFGELSPRDVHNIIITDLALAPRNVRGLVEYSTTFSLAYPSDISKASGVLLYDVVNRGSGDVAATPEGHISLVSGWQGDLTSTGRNQYATVPVAKNKDGSSITGRTLARFLDMPVGTQTLSLSTGVDATLGLRAPPPSSTNTNQSDLYRQQSDTGSVTKISASNWAYADCGAAPFPGKPDPSKICLKGGFDPHYFYTLSYPIKDPLVLGIGLAATRDVIAFFRYAQKDDSGTANPVGGVVRWALGRGVSQSANLLRTFTHLGFNATEENKLVFDGINPIAGARQTPMNYRFAIPGGAAQLYEVGSDGVVWWGDYADKIRGLKINGFMHRCTLSNTCPKVLENIAATELWSLRGSPDLVGTDAKTDLALPANVRRYYSSGGPHNTGPGGFSVDTRPSGKCVLPSNVVPNSDLLHATLKNLVDWVVSGIEPPPSNYPTLASGQLVAPDPQAMGFPTIPGWPSPTNKINPLYQYDFGSKFNYADLSGVITKQPPALKRTLPSLVPKVDADGNEIAGVRSVLVQVPLGTYVGWNVTKQGYYADLACGFGGGYIPFAKTKAERVASGDPRLSIEERYGTHDNFVAKVKTATTQLVNQRFMLPEDAAKEIKAAEDSDILR